MYLFFLLLICGKLKLTLYEPKVITPSWSFCDHVASVEATFRFLTESLWGFFCPFGKDSPWTDRTMLTLSSFANFCLSQQSGFESNAAKMIRAWLSFRPLSPTLFVFVFSQYSPRSERGSEFSNTEYVQTQAPQCIRGGNVDRIAPWLFCLATQSTYWIRFGVSQTLFPIGVYFLFLEVMIILMDP